MLELIQLIAYSDWLLFSWHGVKSKMIFYYFVLFVENTSQGILEEKLITLYEGVQTFVLFIGHARSGHSLIGAILDAHPEIIIPHEYNIKNKWDDYKTKSNGMNDTLKNRLFFDLHSLSRFQAMFGSRAASRCGGTRYCYNVPGQWQGTYKDKIKVRK